MLGTDYSHSDQSFEIDAPRVIYERGGKGELPMPVAQKIVEDNARRFYGL